MTDVIERAIVAFVAIFSGGWILIAVTYAATAWRDQSK